MKVQFEGREIDVPFPNYCHEIEAALCSWEWMLANEDKIEPWDGLGSAAMRMVSVAAGAVVLQVHDHMTAQGYEFTSSYDWEFVPAVLEQIDWEKLCNHNQYSGPAYEPDIAAMFKVVCEQHPRDIYDNWAAAARSSAVKLWAFPQMLEEFEDKIDRTEPPADWVKRIGEKYDLTPAGDWK